MWSKPFIDFVLEHNIKNPIKYLFNWKFQKGRLKVRCEMRSKNNFWGRFGGGWNWKLGFQAGGSTIIISILVMELSISWHKPKPIEPVKLQPKEEYLNECPF